MFKKAILVFVLALCVAAALAQPSTNRKLSKRQVSHEFKSKKYYFETLIKANFFNAFMYCQRQGMQLVTIDSNEEYDYLYKIITTEIPFGHEGKVWTSGTDIAQEGKFTWLSTGFPVRINKWHPRQPDNSDNNEHCIQYWNNRGIIGLNDDWCWREAYFICENRKQ